MIKKWELENFKSVNEKTTLDFAPLTIFAGANSSGKSTIIQSILLTTQTMQSQVHSRPIVLNGHIIRLGTYNDVVSNISRSSAINIGFELAPGLHTSLSIPFQRRYYGRYYPGSLEAIKSIQCNFAFSAEGTDNERDVLQLQPRLEATSLNVSISQEKKNMEELIEISRSKKEIGERLQEYNVSSQVKQKENAFGLEYEVISTGQQTRRYPGVPVGGKAIGASLLHFLPSRLAVVYDVVEEEIRRILEILYNPEPANLFETHTDDMPVLNKEFSDYILQTIEDSIKEVPIDEEHIERVQKALASLRQEFTVSNIRKTVRRLQPNIKREFFRRIDEKNSEIRKMLKTGRQQEFNITYVPLPRFTDTAVDFVQGYFATQVKYLGPLRDEPKPVYPLAGNVDPKDIGFKGENTASVLEVHRNTSIYYIPGAAFNSPNEPLVAEKTTFLSAVLNWLEYMGVAQDLNTSDKGTLGHELKVATPGTEHLHDLTHVGVGVSQVLPILVQSLLSEPGSTLVFEQPELHLHPRVQTRLADFFVSMTMLGKQCIVETHSEYLINRLRYRTATSEDDQLAKNVILYFVEKEKGCSNYRPVKINKYGVIEQWPRGFFDENEVNAAETIKAAMFKRQKEREGKKEP